jgi:hypothetical protein
MQDLIWGGTGAWSRPYRDAGYDVKFVTLPDDVWLYHHPGVVHGILAAYLLAREGKYKFDSATVSLAFGRDTHLGPAASAGRIPRGVAEVSVLVLHQTALVRNVTNVAVQGDGSRLFTARLALVYLQREREQSHVQTPTGRGEERATPQAAGSPVSGTASFLL